MKLVERHIIKKNHKFFSECDRVGFLSKNLYNQALSRIRQHFFETGKYLNYSKLDQVLRAEKQVDYFALPQKVSQLTLKKLDKNFKSFFRAHQTFKKDPSKFLGKPKLPRYLDKTKGRFYVGYNYQAVSRSEFKKSLLQPSQTLIKLPTKLEVFPSEVRIVPRKGYFIIEAIYEKKEKENKKNKIYAGLDLGLDCLGALTFNHREKPILINGRPLKAMNAFYNKKRAKLMSNVGDKGLSTKLEKINFKRNQKIQDYLHKSSNYIVNRLVSLNVSKLVVGRNKNWKQDAKIGKVNTQNFVSIPHYSFLSQLKYKCQLEGIEVIEVDESYTSKCSFLDTESIQKQKVYKGKRISRSWFRTSDGTKIHADCNGSYNIMRKGIPDAFQDGIQGVVVRPVRITPCELKKVA